VRRVSPASFLETRVLARLDALPPRALDAAMLEALRTLGSLTHHDGEMPARIANAPFVATASGRRAPPNVLYDPRVPELAALLKASADESFPAPPFDDPHVLETLSSLGMRKSVTRAAVLDAAVNAERLLATDASAAKRQGLAVLRYLETPEGAKLLSPDSSAKTKSLFGSLFSSSSSSSSGSKKKPSTFVDGAGSDPSTSDVHEPTKLDHQTFVEKLRRVIWAPVSTP
jgi:sacsin